jgi:Zn-finger nucleic acid-binding protein
MKCPVCSVDLMITERQGVEIDYCPQCRGVWLDRGELDKIIDRAAIYEPQNAGRESVDRGGPPTPPPYQEERHRSYGGYREERHRPYGEPKPKKRRSILEDLFDFD